MDNELLRSHAGHVTRLTLNRAAKANALSASLVEALINAVEYAQTDGTRLLIFEGNGSHFCAGFDFSGYDEATEGELVLRFVRIEHLLQCVHHAPFATLALAHGKIFGAGADLVCACSTRIAASACGRVTRCREPFWSHTMSLPFGSRHMTTHEPSVSFGTV